MKLKKLILSGFKSFANRTEFEFDDGVSCIVGPNGCGKSNVVDAVKWVLGEQSAKSLRGSEMLDVIFSGSANRRPSGSAAVTLVFDNASGMLQPPVQSEETTHAEVSVTRRLYRSGQSEYLINKNVARLRDIREMFMDTGIGVDAYGVIEQGRVAMFLQASHDERRAIFDEAAGISKYKARKREALRKLDRVEQNLLRLNDILAEVDKRLRSIKYQAGKARNYQAYSERLKDLKSLHFLANYHTLSGQRRSVQQKLDEHTDALTAIQTRIGQLEASRSAAEVEAMDLERSARELQGKIAGTDGKITACQERASLLTERVTELGDQVVLASRRGEELEAKIDACDREVADRRAEASRAEGEAAELAQQHEAALEEHTAGESAVVHLEAKLEEEKDGTIDLLRRTAQLHNEINASRIRGENLNGRKQRLAGRADQIASALRDTLTERAKVQAKCGDVQEVLSASRARLEEARRTTERVVTDEQQSQADLAAAREQRSGLVSRVDALNEMLGRLEGVRAGARRVLEARRRGSLQVIRGMLGDFIETDVQHAPMVEAALAGADQMLVVDRYADLAAAAEELNELLGKTGAVEVLCLDRLPAFGSDFDISACPQILARVVDYVRFTGRLSPAIWRLLGKTMVVRTLADAAEAAGLAPPGCRFVTRSGEVLEADGRVRLGSANRAAGVIARRSELAELHGRREQLDEYIAELEENCRTAKNERERLDEVAQSLRTAIYEANTERVECEGRISQLNEQIAELQREEPLVADDLKHLAGEIESAVQSEHEATEKAAELERINVERQQHVERLTEQIAAARGRQEELASRMTELKVSLAEAQARKQSCHRGLEDLSQRREQMDQDLSATRAQVAQTRRSRTEAEQAIAAARAEVERLYKEHETFERDEQDVEESRRGLAERLEDIRVQLSARRKDQEQLSEKVNAGKVEIGQAETRIENLISRAGEELGMELLESARTYEHDEQRDWDAVEAEIQELRSKIDRLGNVNLDAISEQDELEQRRGFLGGQLADVQASQDKLNELIRRINKESRELFEKTFVAVRENFQELFRKLFGGGRADILLLDEDDVLESGIEIVARPPGKELRSLSLLSGGEKTMTALALLFSIFKSRPSPFCLLDEVDAALDEANTERFAKMLQEFIVSTQFVIISHAKRTMSMANVLYGVTMQEPGVSKRISVRFEDAGKKLDKQLEPVEA